jgi:hypothetical protein
MLNLLAHSSIYPHSHSDGAMAFAVLVGLCAGYLIARLAR